MRLTVRPSGRRVLPLPFLSVVCLLCSSLPTGAIAGSSSSSLPWRPPLFLLRPLPPDPEVPPPETPVALGLDVETEPCHGSPVLHVEKLLAKPLDWPHGSLQWWAWNKALSSATWTVRCGDFQPGLEAALLTVSYFRNYVHAPLPRHPFWGWLVGRAFDSEMCPPVDWPFHWWLACLFDTPS